MEGKRVQIVKIKKKMLQGHIYTLRASHVSTEIWCVAFICARTVIQFYCTCGLFLCWYMPDFHKKQTKTEKGLLLWWCLVSALFVLFTRHTAQAHQVSGFFCLPTALTAVVECRDGTDYSKINWKHFWSSPAVHKLLSLFYAFQNCSNIFLYKGTMYSYIINKH